MNGATTHLAVMGIITLSVILFPGTCPAQPKAPAFAPVHYDLDLSLDVDAGRLDGSARITLVNRLGEDARQISLLLYRLMPVQAVENAEGEPLVFQQSVRSFSDFPQLQVNHILVSLPEPVFPADTVTISVHYGGHLLGYAETGMAYIRDRIGPDFSIIRQDSWAYPQPGYPSISGLRSAPMPEFAYRAEIEVPDPLIVANGGNLVETRVRDGRTTFVYESVRPSWRMDFAAAAYRQAERGPLRVFYLPEDEEGARLVLSSAGKAMALLEEYFGPLRGTTRLTLLEIPDGWGAQADVAAIIQPASAFRDASRLSEVYHELAHLWQPPDLDRPSARWNEGLATFMANRLAHVLDDSVSQDSLADVRLQRLAQLVGSDPRLKTVALRDYGSHQMTGRSYTVGAVFFDLLFRQLGPAAFDDLVGGFYQGKAETGATLQDFVDRIRATGDESAERLVDEWLLGTAWVESTQGTTSALDLMHRYR